MFTPDLHFYTNGSQLEGKTGAGVAGYHQGDIVTAKFYHLGREIEVFDAELYTIFKATEHDIRLVDHWTQHL